MRPNRKVITGQARLKPGLTGKQPGSLCTSLSLFQSDILDYPACTHSLSAKSVRCQFLSDHLLQDHEFFSLFSLPYLTNALLFLFYTSYDHLSHGVKRLAQRISIPFPSLLLSFQITPYRSKASLILLYSKRRYKELSCI